MTVDGSSVVLFVSQLKQGDPDAAGKLWERFSQRMLQLARARLKNCRPGGFDEEDVALGAFDAFCRAVQNGKFFAPDDPHNLWALLATFTVRKLNDQLKVEGAAKRGGDVRQEDRETRSGQVPLDRIPSTLLGPVSNAILSDEYRRLFRLLNDPELEKVAVLKLEGYTNDEVAQELGYTRRTIQRMLNLIRVLWQNDQK